MTMTPEVPLAAELGIGTVNLSFVTDADAGLAPAADETTTTDEAPVTHAAVMERLARANEVIVRAIGDVVAALPDDYTPRELVPTAASESVLRKTADA
jgi:5'-methylthioadenosine phosphorylase